MLGRDLPTTAIAPSYMSPNAGGGGVAGSQPVSSLAVHRRSKGDGFYLG
jgi:hypothetical protein